MLHKITKDFVIVGGGPVGLSAALFLKKINKDFILLEKNPNFSTHPSAHYLNMRTMEVFSEIEGLTEKIYKKIENREFSRYYRYCRRLFDKNGVFAISDHFKPNIDEKLRELAKFSFESPVHLPQFSLLEILAEKLRENGGDKQVFLGKEVENIKTDQEKVEKIWFLLILIKK